MQICMQTSHLWWGQGVFRRSRDSYKWMPH